MGFNHHQRSCKSIFVRDKNINAFINVFFMSLKAQLTISSCICHILALPLQCRIIVVIKINNWNLFCSWWSVDIRDENIHYTLLIIERMGYDI